MIRKHDTLYADESLFCIVGTQKAVVFLGQDVSVCAPACPWPYDVVALPWDHQNNTRFKMKQGYGYIALACSHYNVLACLNMTVYFLL